MKKNVFVGLLALSLAAGTAQARVKLVAIPERARVVVSLSNPNETLIEEERLVTLQKGVNQVDFSWRGVNIDPSTIQVRPLGGSEKVVVLNTSYPPNENALIWAVSSPVAKEERIRISYILNGLTREITYRAVAEPNETSIALRNYFRLRNNSGEDLTDAELTIGYGAGFKKTIANEEILEMQAEKIDSLPIRKLLTWDGLVQPWDPEYEKKTVGLPLSYVIKIDAASKLGTHTMLPGKARIFIKTKDQPAKAGEAATEGVAFIGEDWVTLTPADRELRLSIGQSRDVKVTQRRMKSDRSNIRRNNSNAEVLWDLDETYKIEIENFKKVPADLVVIEHFPGYWKLSESSHKYERKDAFTVEYPLTLAAETTGDKKTTVSFQLKRLNVQGNEPASY